MVKDIKELDAELNAHSIAKRRVLTEGQIGVIEARAGDHVAPQIAESIHWNKCEAVEPAIDTANDFDGASNIGPERVNHAVHKCVACKNVYRTAALRLE